MTVQRFQFQPPPRTTRATKSRVELFPMNRGFNPSIDALRLERGEASFIENMHLNEGYITPRSGLSFKDDPSGTRCDHAARTFDTVNERFVTINNTNAYINASVNLFSFTTLSGPTLAAVNVLSVGQNQYWDSTNIYDAATRQNLFVFTNGSNAANHPMTLSTDGSSYITLDSFLSSGESRAHLVESFDDRLVFFNSVDSKGTLNPTRVRWSVRGNPSDLSNPGAGFEDLFDMAGAGTALVAEEGRLLLMSDSEIWQATPRRDAFAFEFDVLDKSIGCQIPRSVTKTPAGVFFLSDGLALYRVAGSVVRPLSRKINEFIQEKINNLDHIWGAYNSANRSFWLFFGTDARGVTTNGIDQAIEIYIDTLEPQNNGSDDFEFVFHSFNNFSLSAGAQFWGSGDWTSGSKGQSSLCAVSSTGSVLQFRSDQTTDSGSTFASRWQSPKMKAKDPNTKEAINEAWFDTGMEPIQGVAPAFSSQTATLEFFTSIDQGATYTNVGSVSINTIDSLNTTSKFTTAFLPITPQSTQHPQFEIRVLDGSRPRISATRIALKQYTGRF